MVLSTRLPRSLLAVLVLQGLVASFGVLVGVDLGSQYFKAAIVSPGKPFDVVHNQHSKRKTPTVVSFHEKVRTFGDDALAGAARGLQKTPMFFTRELGRNLTETSSGSHHWLPKMFYPYKLGVNDSGTIQFQFGEDGAGVTVEEATAHILGFVKRLSEEAADGNAVTESVLTISSQATFAQRRALLAAADIARLPGVKLLHETSAAALQRAPDLILGGNDTANTSTVLYYNMGARHVEVCIVAYHAATHMSKPTVAMDVLGCNINTELGGHHVDMLVAEQMRNAFGQKHPKLAEGLSTSVRALKKLEKEAMGMKHVLSANKEANFRVEALYEDTDFSQVVKRETLEAWCEPLFKVATTPIEAALQAANVTLDDIDTVEMIGGGWRMPKVQSLLSDYLKSHRAQDAPVLNLSQHLNGEESMATGAALFGANSSTSFRVKKIFFTDVMPHGYALVLSPLNASQLNATEEGWSRGVELFPAFSKLRAKKTVKLHVGFDVSMTLLENGNPVATWELSGIHATVNDIKYENLSAPLISLKVELDTSGVVRITSAQAIFDEPYTVTTIVTPRPAVIDTTANTTANTTSNTTESDSNSSTAAEGESAESEPQDGGETPKEAPPAQDGDGDGDAEAPAAETGTEGDNTTTDSNGTKTITKTKVRKIKVTLPTAEQFEGIIPRPLSDDEKAWATSRMDDMNAADTEVRNAEAAKNALEAFVYESREKVTGDEHCLQVSTEEEREEISSMLMATEDWLYEDEALNGNTSVFEAKRDELNQKVGPIRSRAFELEQRPQLPELVEKIAEYVNQTLTYVKQNLTWVAEKEIEGVKNLTINFDDWYVNVTDLQSKRPLTETPAYSAYDVKVRLQQMRDEAIRLTKIRKIDPMPYNSDYGRYGGYDGGYGGYGGYNDPKMREYYRRMYENMSGNGSGGNYSDFMRGFGSNFSNFSNRNDSDYMRSFYENMARNAAQNFSSEQAGGSDSTSDAPPPPENSDASPAPAESDAPAPAGEGEKAEL